ncbi:lipid II:glycine glycyltransferase FemX [Halosimplex sp. J119]
MTIDITRITADDFDEWDRHVRRSPEATVFHRSAVLEHLADYTGATLHALVGYKGQEPVGVFPLFELEKGPIRMAFSPPPGTWVDYLGPACLNMAKLSRRKAERRHERFIEGSLEYVDERIDPLVTRVETTPLYDDVRPFQWDGHSVELNYSYVVELTDEDDLLSRFSSDARRNIRDADADAFEISRGDAGDVRVILDQVARRYREQGEAVSVPTEFVAALARSLPDDAIAPYVCHVDGEFAGGILVVADDDTVYRWFGGVSPHREVSVAVNDLLDWHVMTEAMDDGRSYYDLVGAGARSVNEYKAKFAPELRTFYAVESNPVLMEAMSTAHGQVQRHKSALDLDGPMADGVTRLVSGMLRD